MTDKSDVDVETHGDNVDLLWETEYIVREKKVSNNVSRKKIGGGLAGDVASVLVVFVSLFGLDICCFGKRGDDECDDDDDDRARSSHPCLPYSTPGCCNWRDCRSHFFQLEWMVT